MIPIARNVEKCNFKKIEKKFTFEKFVVSDWQASLKFHYSNTCNIEVFNNRLNFYR